ncbi:MAG: hypothetical protein ACTSXT_13660 [Candidatus Helarchaeota archaeon]
MEHKLSKLKKLFGKDLYWTGKPKEENEAFFGNNICWITVDYTDIASAEYKRKDLTINILNKLPITKVNFKATDLKGEDHQLFGYKNLKHKYILVIVPTKYEKIYNTTALIILETSIGNILTNIKEDFYIKVCDFKNEIKFLPNYIGFIKE